MSSTTAFPQSVANMRRDFDGAFAVPIAGVEESREPLLTISLTGREFAVRTAHITGIAKLKRIVPVPTGVPDLLGITAVHGALFPAYDLGTLLGLSAVGNEHPRILLANRETPVALVFDQFEGQVEIDRACIFDSDSSRSNQHLREIAKVAGAHRAVIDIPGIVEAIRNNAGIIGSAKE